MADTATTHAQGPTAFRFSEVHTCKIHPGIGIARVGNSPDEYFVGPEAPCDPREVAAPDGAFKDANGRIKRQAARFRIYAYDKDGNNLGELPLKGAADRADGQVAHVEWRVHLKNKKGSWHNFYSRFDKSAAMRNLDPNIPVEDGHPPDSRLPLVIDPGPRGIDGEGSPVQQRGGAKSTSFNTGQFRGTTVPLGDLKVDEHGRLLVLGGFGNSGSVIPDNPIGADSGRDDYWVNNDNWYDDISDGPVTAKVTLPNGDSIAIDQPRDAAWVIVCPPKYAPGIYSIVTLYDVMRDVAIQNGWINNEPDVSFQRDIRPVLLRATEMAWVNREAQSGHGYDKLQHFLADADIENAASRLGTKLDAGLILFRLRKPQPRDEDEAKRQATAQFMPPLSGDGGPRTEGEPETWLSLLPSQYRKFEMWEASGGLVSRGEPTLPRLESMNPDEQVEALQRGALEPCAGGPFYPGIEVPWIVNTKDLYVAAFRIDSTVQGPGDITKSMGIPWQATFYDCKDTWWPAVRPDDVIPQDVFEEANKAWRPGQVQQVQVSEALEGRVKWDRGLGVTTLFRRPWHNPAAAIDDPRDSGRRGCDDMVRYWHELGFILPRRTAWRDGMRREIVHIEMERLPHAGMDVRELFHCLLNLEEKRTCLPKVEQFVENVLEASRQLQQTSDAFAFMENIRPFEYDESVFEARMQDIYDDCADFAFTTHIEEDGVVVLVPYDPTDINQNPYFQTREHVTERIRQLTPFNFLDGSWLRNIHRVGPVDEVNSILFTILKEELGDGVPSQNHANIYQDLCHSFGFYPPPIQSTAFARDPAFLDCAFDSPTFQLGISEFSRRYYPEIIGMSLWLEWTVMELHRIASIVEQTHIGLSSHFYRMHIAIDNAASGHGAGIIRAVKLYLQQIRAEGGEEAVQQHWKRIWDGYVAFAYTFVIVIEQIKKIIDKPPSLQQQLEWMITRKAPFGRLNHHEHRLGGAKINSLFADPPALLKALKKSKYIVPGKPDESRFFELLKFRGGPMYHVFNDDEVKLWRDWIRELGEESKERQAEGLPALKDRIAKIDPALAEIAPDAQLATWQSAASDRRIALWAEIASSKIAMKNKISRADLTKSDQRNDVQKSIHDRYTTWLGWGMVRTLTFIAAQHRDSVEKSDLTLADPDTGQELTVKEWLDRIRESSNPSVPARALLQSFRDLHDDKRMALRKQSGPETPMGRALGERIPGNDGRRGWDTMEAWFKAGCPVPEATNAKVRPLRLDSTLQEEETHPTGLAIGFGTVH
jgi:hypothetical protein